MAVVSLGGLYTLNAKLENSTVEQISARISWAAEESYRCWDAGTCRHDNDLIGGWNPDLTTDDYNSHLSIDTLHSYAASLDEPVNGKINNLVITVSQVKSAIGQRVVRILGGAATYTDDPNSNNVGDVQLMVGIPGTEFALRGMVKQAVETVRTQDLEFGPTSQEMDEAEEGQVFLRNISGAGDVSAETITIDNIKIDKDMAVAVQSLSELTGTNACDYGVDFIEGKFECAPEAVFCSMPDKSIQPVGAVFNHGWRKCNRCKHNGVQGRSVATCQQSGSTTRKEQYRCCRTCCVVGKHPYYPVQWVD